MEKVPTSHHTWLFGEGYHLMGFLPLLTSEKVITHIDLREGYHSY